jgi:hypothetical protein
LDSRVLGSHVVREARRIFKAIENKGFKEERRTKNGLYAIGTFTTLESNKSLSGNHLNSVECGPGHRLILTTVLILFSAAARARIIASRFAHPGLLHHVTVGHCQVVEGKTPARRADTPRYST